MRNAGVGLGLGGLFVVALASCRDATRIVLSIGTDLPCAQVKRTTITASRPRESEIGLASSTETEDCSGGMIGDLTVVPDSDNGAEVAIRVVVGVDRVAQECSAQDNYRGCIVARRRIRYIANTTLNVPIRAYLACKDVICEVDSTCNRLGRCVPAALNADDCNAPGGCNVEGERAEASPDASAGDAAPAATCESTLVSFCDKFLACSPVYFQTQWESLSACRELFLEECKPLRDAPGSNVTSAQWQKCATDLAGASCATFPAVVPDSCAFRGIRPSGAPCGLGAQCAGGACFVATGDCGSCAELVGTGADCSKNICASGLRCGDNKKCETDPAVLPPVSLGAACKPSGGPCDPTLGGACVPNGDAGSGDGTCKAVKFAKSGEPCGLLAGEEVVCFAGQCHTHPDQKKRCVSLARIGGACDDAVGPLCQAGTTQCVAGKCQYRDLAACK